MVVTMNAKREERSAKELEREEKLFRKYGHDLIDVLMDEYQLHEAIDEMYEDPSRAILEIARGAFLYGYKIGKAQRANRRKEE